MLPLRLTLATRDGLPHDSRRDWDCDAPEAVEGKSGVTGVEGARASAEDDAAEAELAVRARLFDAAEAAVGAVNDPDGMLP